VPRNGPGLFRVRSRILERRFRGTVRLDGAQVRTGESRVGQGWQRRRSTGATKGEVARRRWIPASVSRGNHSTGRGEFASARARARDPFTHLRRVHRDRRRARSIPPSQRAARHPRYRFRCVNAPSRTGITRRLDCPAPPRASLRSRACVRACVPACGRSSAESTMTSTRACTRHLRTRAPATRSERGCRLREGGIPRPSRSLR